MNNFVFENSTKVYFGKGSVKEYLADALSSYRNNVLLAYGGGSIKKNGVYDEVTAILETEGKNIIEFSDIMANPTYEKVLEGAKLAKENQADVILGVGGGSVMDCCKAVSMAAVCQEDVWENFWARPGIVDFEPLPLGVIVTVSGTGSEMNGGAVITNEKVKVKTGRDYPKCNPKFALMNPEYTFTVSPKQTASGGFDILSHIMEIYFSDPNVDNVSDDISEALMRSVIRNLPMAVKSVGLYSQEQSYVGIYYGGKPHHQVGKKTDFQAHQIEHQLGAYTDCNHGAGLAVISPVYYQHIYSHGLYKFGCFARNVWNIQTEGKTEDELARAGIKTLSDFSKEIGLPTTLRELGINDKDMLKQVADSCNISAGSYKKMTHQEILTILEECY